jgi:hypothetical protein
VLEAALVGILQDSKSFPQTEQVLKNNLDMVAEKYQTKIMLESRLATFPE